MPSPDQIEALAELYKRGALDSKPDMKSAFEELIRRGQVPSLQERNLRGTTANIVRGLPSGFADPVHGIVEGIGQIMPGEVGESMREYEAQRSGSLAKEGPGFGIGQAIGSAANPITWGPGRAIRGTGAAAQVGKQLLGAEVGALTQPTSGQNFGAEKTGQAIGGLAAGGATAIGSEAARAGTRAITNQIAKRYPSALQDKAVQEVLRRMEQDRLGGGPTATDAINLVNKLFARGQPATLADVAGASTRRLAGGIYRQPGAARQIVESSLTDRDREALNRSIQAISQHISGGPSMFLALEALFRARSANAAPLYDVALEPTRIVDSPLIRRFLADPTIAKGIGPGMESQRLDALANGRKFQPNAAQYVVTDANGVPIGVKGVPNMGILDAVKRGLDDAVEKETDSVTGRVSSRGYQLNQVRAAFLQELDRLNPDYAAARAAWAGPSKAMEAIKLGRTIFQRSPDEIASEFKALSRPDRQMMRLGVADTLRERIMKTGTSGDEGRAMLRSEYTKRQLAPIFRSEKDYDDFVDKVMTESKMWGTKQSVMGGSQTAERLAEDTSQETSLAGTGARIAMSAAKGHVFDAIKQALEARRIALGKGSDPQLNEEMAKILFATPIPRNMRNQLLGRGRPAAVRIGEGMGRASQMVGTALAPAAGAAISQPANDALAPQ